MAGMLMKGTITPMMAMKDGTPGRSASHNGRYVDASWALGHLAAGTKLRDATHVAAVSSATTSASELDRAVLSEQRSWIGTAAGTTKTGQNQ
eukprot:943787-Amphidinium_carterae.1